MLSHTLLTTCLLGILLPLTSPAQTAPASSRFYVGVGANLLSNTPFKDRGIVPRILGPSITAGVNFMPRLALQVGLSYHGKKDTYDDMFASPAVVTTVSTKYLVIPALLRYTVTTPINPINFDVLGGATLVHVTGHTTYSATPSTYNEYSDSDTRFNLTLGPAVRAAISSHLELTATSLVSMVVGENYYNFSDRLFLNTSLGINYKFN
ncbi:porin family protein [Hymenobacter sp. UV11]|uniref:porin family protein n=1 Tax=Hymenobacter sp. UV11 TaxID=1849735 RepID=UPI0010608B8C|nr:porin family protein [Hymenobacter sp. UV11]